MTSLAFIGSWLRNENGMYLMSISETFTYNVKPASVRRAAILANTLNTRYSLRPD